MREDGETARAQKLGANRFGLTVGQCRDVTSMLSRLVESAEARGDDVYSGYDFLDDVSGKRLDRHLAVEATKLEIVFSAACACTKRCPGRLRGRTAARSSARGGWTLTRATRLPQTIDPGSLGVRLRRIHVWICSPLRRRRRREDFYVLFAQAVRTGGGHTE